MQLRPVLSVLALVCAGLVLGAVVFRSAIAPATAASNAVPAKADAAKGTVKISKMLTLEYLNGSDDQTFTAMKASLITIRGDLSHTEWLYLKSKGQFVMFFALSPNEQIVLPLSSTLAVDEVVLSSCFGSIQCFANVNILGT